MNCSICFEKGVEIQPFFVGVVKVGGLQKNEEIHQVLGFCRFGTCLVMNY